MQQLVGRLGAADITHCRWEPVLPGHSSTGVADLGLLVAPDALAPLHRVLHECGFSPACDLGGRTLTADEHHFALDDDSGHLVHVRSTCWAVPDDCSPWSFRAAQMLLDSARPEAGISVPAPGGELVALVLWAYLTATPRRSLELAREPARLFTPEVRTEGALLVARWFPEIEPVLFSDAVESLIGHASRRHRLAIAIRLRHALPHRGFSHTRPRPTPPLAPAGGGAVIAFVGSEASGKTTLLAETADWLRDHFTVERVHAGKPPPTWLTVTPNLLIPILRRVFPQQRSTRVDLSCADRLAGDRDLSRLPLLFAVRSVLLAHDRHALLRRAHARSVDGSVVLTDRYPSADVGAPDSRQLPVPTTPSWAVSLRPRLAALEARLYDDIPPPDLVIHVKAPLDVVLERNRSRGKTEPEDLVRLRHAQTTTLRFAGTRTHVVDTSRPLAESLRTVRRLVWDVLTSPQLPAEGVAPLRPVGDAR